MNPFIVTAVYTHTHLQKDICGLLWYIHVNMAIKLRERGLSVAWAWAFSKSARILVFYTPKWAPRWDDSKNV